MIGIGCNMLSIIKKNNLLCLALSIGCLSASFAAVTTKAEPLDKIVAVVNDDIITNSDLAKKVTIIKNQLSAQSAKLPPLNEIRKQVLNAMILDSLQLQVAKLNNISASEDQVNAAIETVAKQHNLNVLNFRKKLESDGLNYNEFKKDILNQLTIMNVQRAIASSEVKVSNQEVTQEIKRLRNDNSKASYKLSHILIAVPNSPDTAKIQAAKDRATGIAKDLQSGHKKFAQTAMIVSDGQQALNGGDLGWYNIADLPSLFADIVPKLNRDQVYGPIQDESGFHIIKLTDAKSNSQKYQEMQYKVRHILIKKDDITTDAVAQKQLNKIKADIKKNNNFSDLALIYSEDVASASNGGELGWVSSYAVVPEFANTIASLKVNEISEPFRTAYGWHIAQLEDKKIVDNTENWKKTQAKQIIENRKFQDALASWQNKLKSESTIEIMI